MNLRNLTGAEFLRYAETVLDPITSTELEIEMLKRLRESTDKEDEEMEELREELANTKIVADEAVAFQNAIYGTGFNVADDIVALLNVLQSNEILTPAALEAVVKQADKYLAILKITKE